MAEGYRIKAAAVTTDSQSLSRNAPKKLGMPISPEDSIDAPDDDQDALSKRMNGFHVSDRKYTARLPPTGYDTELRHLRVDLESPKFKCVRYYCRQSFKELGKGAPFDMPVWIAPDTSDDSRVSQDWYKYLNKAISDINEAAPGLQLRTVNDETKANIRVVGKANSKGAETSLPKTRSRPLSDGSCEIIISWPSQMFLGANTPKKQMKAASIHEFFHALGFDHEHQRKDARESMKNETQNDYNLEVQDNIAGLTRFDVFSIMQYPECQQLVRDSHLDPVWDLKKDSKDQNDTLSELDKVGLNLLYVPCKSPSYKPKKSTSNSMWYCGRRVMASHNAPKEKTMKGEPICGPEVGPNCPACRTLKSTKVDEFLSQGRWQGWSGLVYCGKSFQKQSPKHEGCCGPDNGIPCDECLHILYP